MAYFRPFVIMVLFAVLGLAGRGFAARVSVLVTPDGGEVPAVVVDAKGVLHLAYGRDGDAYYVQSRDWGGHFTAPVRINQRPGTVTVGGERGPKLALGRDGVIHVVWMGDYRKGGGVWYARSTDGGRTFAPERSMQGVKAGCDGATVAADGAGNVVVVWLDARLPEDPNSPIALPIYLARSQDDGATFTAAEPVKHDHPGRACSCCALNTAFGADGLLYITFRSGFHNIRDMYLLRGPKLGNDFHAVRIHEDNWYFEGCPMTGAPFMFLKDGRVLVAWRSRDRVYWSLSDPGATAFRPPVTAPAADGENHPRVIANRQGEVLFAWVAGQEVHWSIYDLDGKPTGQSGLAGSVKGLNRFAVFTGPGGRFFIVR